MVTDVSQNQEHKKTLKAKLWNYYHRNEGNVNCWSYYTACIYTQTVHTQAIHTNFNMLYLINIHDLLNQDLSLVKGKVRHLSAKSQ